jgi:hypothetical protein
MKRLPAFDVIQNTSDTVPGDTAIRHDIDGFPDKTICDDQCIDPSPTWFSGSTLFAKGRLDRLCVEHRFNQ